MTSTNDETYDVVVAGAGPAGSTAAVLLAKAGHRVALVDREKFPRPVTCAGWLNTLATPLLGEIGVDLASFSAHTCSDITLYKDGFSEKAKPKFARMPAHLIDRTRFDHELVKAAATHGADVIEGCGVIDVQFKESVALVKLADKRELATKLLLLAGGRQAGLLDRIGIGVATGGSAMASGQVEASLEAKDAPKEPYIGIVLGLDRTASFGIFCVGPDRMSVGVTCTGERDEAVRTLMNLCRQVFEQKLVPLDLTRQASSVKPVSTPASAALDMETHVGKHTLVIGEAGGFVSAVSNEGIYPSMWSAQIATEVAARALRSPRPQEELMSFDSQWRIQMADYLRSPHTDIQFLLPLIFTNQPMADRMGAAFFFGENI